MSGDRKGAAAALRIVAAGSGVIGLGFMVTPFLAQRPDGIVAALKKRK